MNTPDSSGSGLDILHDDALLIAVNKPSGVLSVPGRGALAHGSMAEQVQQRFPDAKVVHRLDMATSGILLFAKGLDAQRWVSRQFELRKIRKEYLAVVSGLMRDDNGEINAPLIADWPQRPRQKVDSIAGKEAITQYQVIERNAEHTFTRVQLYPITGRSHQLRVHLRWIGHPILGDQLYAPIDDADRAKRLLLHACGITLEKAGDCPPLTIQCPAPF